jgi:hypothetical protein
MRRMLSQRRQEHSIPTPYVPPPDSILEAMLGLDQHG